ncbi:MAG: 2-C-methyl-D-erythritol 4-phosphate cytidylyltransferase [Candidatus Caenarcaniphilales bacterium]|jgi:2-C-methyl-D-erythritol 4-phosphate cytidylyltransferase|nr:2-C-methyl-D-erythritol 4-phosphate cytidylyltransferase [Candidatus Caenarcaniphilales bacterium]
MTTIYAIIPAGGIGKRMQSQKPKQFLAIDDKPIIIVTLAKLISTGLIKKFIIPTVDIVYTKKIIKSEFPDLDFIICKSGKSRQDSIQNAILEIKALEEKADLILIHDAVRPLIKKTTIEQVVKKALETGAAVAGRPVSDTLKLAFNRDGENIIKKNVSRDSMWHTQTPQVYHSQIFFDAYQKALEDHFEGTDSAGLVERINKDVYLVESPQSNIKITTPDDLELAKILAPYT